VCDTRVVTFANSTAARYFLTTKKNDGDSRSSRDGGDSSVAVTRAGSGPDLPAQRGRVEQRREKVAHTVADGIPIQVLQLGAEVDMRDGTGTRRHAGVDILPSILHPKFPPDAEASTLRTRLEFFYFTPARDGDLESMFLRFDMLLDRANSAAELGASVPFRTWAPLSLLRLLPE
ncbi:unnamed protein product, partial [Prorocentrum cordatum]